MRAPRQRLFCTCLVLFLLGILTERHLLRGTGTRERYRQGAPQGAAAVARPAAAQAYREDLRRRGACVGGRCPEPAVEEQGLSAEQSAVSDDEGLVALEDGGALEAAGTATEEPPAASPPVAVAPPAQQLGCTFTPGSPQSSRPGRPCLPAADVWPWATNTPWRTALGERLLASVTPSIGAGECGGFHLFGDQTWCLRAMGGQAGLLGLSYGIEERDLWSETMSNRFRVPTWLFDCFIPPERSPPMAGVAPNATGACTGRQQHGVSHCYEVPYWPVRACLANEEGSIQGRRYETLASHLRGRGPLSTHVKIDVEGSEWSVLEQLLASKEDIGKIRSLDMEVHLGFRAASEAAAAGALATDEARVEREVRIMEGLGRAFAVTGTTLEVYREGWRPAQDCPTQSCNEPCVHTAGGFGLAQFAVSYVSRRLVQ